MTDETGIIRQEAEFLLFQTEDGLTRVEVRFIGETAWLSLKQMAELFQRDKSVISRHIKNVFDEGELLRDSVVAEFATTAADSKTYQVEHFNLDDFLNISDRQILTHAGQVSHEAALSRAQLEYDRFAAQRRALPAPVEKHFDDAAREVKLLEKQRPADSKPKPKPKTGKGAVKRPGKKKR